MVTERKRGMKMQDRYLFRGKRAGNGEWVIWDAITGIPHDLYIQVKTICQCTGLKDKNGTLIWENDIVNGSIKRGAAFYRCLVLWNECKARFDVRAQGCNFPMTLDECTDDISMSGFEYEVVGNKFDNPELLEE
jgi:hypothetical protein